MGVNNSSIGGKKSSKSKKQVKKNKENQKRDKKQTKKNKTGKVSKWIMHVKAFAKSHKMKYPDALKHPDCKKSYKKI